jgi:hypothetical protein
MATGPAPDGEPAVVAQQVILDNFDKADCPLVTDAKRLGDGSIKTACNNGETYRVLSIPKLGKAVAMKCSALAALGIAGC